MTPVDLTTNANPHLATCGGQILAPPRSLYDLLGCSAKPHRRGFLKP